MSSVFETPLSAAYGALSGKTIDEESAQKIARETAGTATDYAKVKAAELKDYAENGNWTWKVAGLICGSLMIICGILGFLSSIFSLSPFAACLDVYIFIFGVLSVCLEYKDQVMMKSYVNLIRREAHILITPSGRAGFYIFVGILMFSKGGLLNILAGLFMIVIGAVIFQSCRKAFAALNELKTDKYTEAQLIENFNEHDINKDGELDSREFAEVNSTKLTI
jgi:vacuolar-type H+-ATPase subunit I/STV1